MKWTWMCLSTQEQHSYEVYHNLTSRSLFPPLSPNAVVWCPQQWERPTEWPSDKVVQPNLQSCFLKSCERLFGLSDFPLLTCSCLQILNQLQGKNSSEGFVKILEPSLHFVFFPPVIFLQLRDHLSVDRSLLRAAELADEPNVWRRDAPAQIPFPWWKQRVADYFWLDAVLRWQWEVVLRYEQKKKKKLHLQRNMQTNLHETSPWGRLSPALLEVPVRQIIQC